MADATHESAIGYQPAARHGRVITVIGRLGRVRPGNLEAWAATAGVSVRRGITRRTDMAVVGAKAWSMVDDGGLQRRIATADKYGAAVISEGRLAGIIGGRERPHAPRSITADDMHGRAQIDDGTLRLLSLFDVVTPDGDGYSFQDLVAAREVGRLLREGASLGRILAGVDGLSRHGRAGGRVAGGRAAGGGEGVADAGDDGPGAHLAAAKLVVNEAGELALKVGSGAADLSGQMRMALPGTDNPSVDDLFASAEDAEDSGDLGSAEKLYRRCIEREKSDCPARFNLANVLRDMHRLDEARDVLRDVLRHDPSFAEAWYNMADLAQTGGDDTEAERCLEQALQVDGDYADALYNLARLRFHSGDYVGARDYWRRYLSFDETSDWSQKARDGVALCRYYLQQS